MEKNIGMQLETENGCPQMSFGRAIKTRITLKYKNYILTFQTSTWHPILATCYLLLKTYYLLLTTQLDLRHPIPQTCRLRRTLGPHHPAQGPFIRPEPEGSMALPRSANAFREKRFYRTIQADDPRPFMAFDTAHLHYHHVSAGVWQDRQHTHRRGEPSAVLYGWHHHLELFFGLPDYDIRHLRSQCGDFWESLFSKTGDSSLQCFIQHGEICNPVFTITGHDDLLFF